MKSHYKYGGGKGVIVQPILKRGSMIAFGPNLTHGAGDYNYNDGNVERIVLYWVLHLIPRFNRIHYLSVDKNISTSNKGKSFELPKSILDLENKIEKLTLV